MLKRRKFEMNMACEIEFHLEQATQEYIACGLSPQEARLRARREFGPIDLAKEELRDAATPVDRRLSARCAVHTANLAA